MKYIKVKNTSGKTLLVNLDLVTHFFGVDETATMICYGHPDEYDTVNVPIENIKDAIESLTGVYITECD